jgi:hypothetical protein
MALKALFESPKSIPVSVQWTDGDTTDGYTRFLAPLEIDGLVEAGLTLTGGAYTHHPDRHVTLELAIIDQTTGRRIRLARIDWKSLTGGHTNQRGRCGAWGGKRLPATHLHSFDLNWVEAEQRMRRGKLPCAEPIPQALQAFDELRRFCGTCFRINNIDVVPPPDWVYQLDLDI